MLTFPVDQWIGNAAAVLSGVWGAVTQRSTPSGSSRTAMYQHAERVVQAVANAPAGGISSEALWAENEWLKAENEALWQAWSEGEERSECQQHALVSAGSAMGLRLPQMVLVLALVWPSRLVPSRATVGRWGQPSAQQARGILEGLDRACQGFGLVWCLDEIVLHRAPILMGVEPLSWAWLAGQRGPDRRGESWCEVLAPWPNLEHGIAAGGPGLARGVHLAHAARPQGQEPAAELPAPIPMGLAVFHTQREWERVLQRLWNRGERQSEAAVKAEAKREQARRRGPAPRGVAGQAGRAGRQAERLVDAAVQAQEAVEQSKEALGWCEASGPLDAREPAQEQLHEAMPRLQGDGGKKAQRMLSDARTLRHVARLPAPWRSAIAEPMVRNALAHWWYVLRRLKPAEGHARVPGSQVVAMACVLCGRLCPEWQAGYVKVDALLHQAVRARSAVEGVHSVLRMHQGRHRHVGQEMLDLKRLYGHCRVCREGKRKGRSPDELLGFKLPTSDWWQLLQMDPKELEQVWLTQ